MSFNSLDLWLLNPWNVWKYQGEKSKVPNWVGVAKWVDSFWSSPPCPDAFLSFPATPEDDVHHVCSSGRICFSPKFSFCMCLPRTSGLIDKERSRDGGADILLQRDNTFPFPGLNPHFFPNTWSLAWCYSSPLQISEGRDGVTQVGGLSWLWKPSQLLMSLRSALLVSGAFIRLRESWCEDLSEEFVLESL